MERVTRTELNQQTARVLARVAAGERIVIDGTGKLRPGVKVADAAPAAPAKQDAPAADSQG